MRRTRRVTVEFEHRKLIFSLTGVSVPVGPVVHPGTAPDQTPATSLAKTSEATDRNPNPKSCPECGAAWITVAARAGVEPGPDAVAGVHAIQQALQQRGLHLQVSPAGELRICSRSFEELSFDEIRSQETRPEEEIRAKQIRLGPILGQIKESL